MAKDFLNARRASFLSVGDDYARTRPQYPIDAVKWIAGGTPQDVLDLGCGPGKLTSQLIELGHRVVGLDPSFKMLQAVPGTCRPVVCGTAEAIPLKSGSKDVVTAAQAFHWFDHARAVPEIRRVLGQGGRVGVLWNLRDEHVGWVRELSRIIGSEDAMAATTGEREAFEEDVRAKLQHGGHFVSVESKVFAHSQELTEEGLVGLVSSRSYVAILPETKRTELLAAVVDLCRTHPQLKGAGKFTLPYRTVAYRTTAASPRNPGN